MRSPARGGLAHRRELRADGARDGRVVEAHDRDVLGNADARAAERRERTAGHEIARDEERVELARIEDPLHRGGAAVGREVAVLLGDRLEPGGGERIAEAHETVDAGGHRDGPAIVAIRRKPRPIRYSVASRPPATLSTST
jgi:hypothetical protein